LGQTRKKFLTNASQIALLEIMEIMENAAEILVVDDEPSVALAIQAALRFCGFRVVTVRSGEMALDCIQAEPDRFAMVLSDHKMPGLGGLALVRALRDAAYPGRIVILSAYLSWEVEDQYRVLGVDEMLSKPFNLDRLRMTVGRALDRAKCAA
jgi:DNA-binding response OmpR family regulator